MNLQFNNYLFVLFLFLSQNITAQRTREVQTQNHFWTSINTQARISNKWSVVADLHIRRTNYLKNNNFYYTRAGAAYHINKNLSVSLSGGHMWLANKTATTELFVNENRLVQQIQLVQPLGKLQLLQRLRIEERWIQNVINSELSDTYRYSTRFRYQLAASIPLSKNKYFPSLAFSDELMMQAGKHIIYNNFDQNRFFAGIKQQIMPSLAADFGYMHVWQQRLSGYQYNRNHTIRLFFYWQPDLRKKQLSPPTAQNNLPLL
jgi:long-subunit fatty acid transport protein